jgi:hypothetical protein
MNPPSFHQSDHEVRLTSRDREHDRVAAARGPEGVADLRCRGSGNLSNERDDISLL